MEILLEPKDSVLKCCLGILTNAIASIAENEPDKAKDLGAAVFTQLATFFMFEYLFTRKTDKLSTISSIKSFLKVVSIPPTEWILSRTKAFLFEVCLCVFWSVLIPAGLCVVQMRSEISTWPDGTRATEEFSELLDLYMTVDKAFEQMTVQVAEEENYEAKIEPVMEVLPGPEDPAYSDGLLTALCANAKRCVWPSSTSARLSNAMRSCVQFNRR